MLNKKTKRNWGYFITLLILRYLKIKLLVLKKDKAIHLQSHQYRSELWFVLKGKGTARIKDTQEHIHFGSIIYVPKKALHKLQCMSSRFYILELQWGKKCVEEDIIHFD